MKQSKLKVGNFVNVCKTGHFIPTPRPPLLYKHSDHSSPHVENKILLLDKVEVVILPALSQNFFVVPERDLVKSRREGPPVTNYNAGCATVMGVVLI